MNASRRAWSAMLLALLMATACTGSVQEPTTTERTPSPSPSRSPSPSPTSTARFSNPAVQNTYQNAVDLCGHFGPEETAREYGVSGTSDLDTIARAYSMGSVEREGHRQAAYVGCLEGLMVYEAEHS